MGMELKKKLEVAQILNQNMVVNLVKVKIRQLHHVMMDHALSMVAGLTGVSGVLVLQLVAMEPRKNPELAQTLNHNMEVKIAKGKIKSLVHVTMDPVLLMVAGLIGVSGVIVLQLVAMEPRKNPDLAQTPNHNMEVKLVREKIKQLVHVTMDLVLLMVAGLIGVSGVIVLQLVAMEPRKNPELAQTPNHNMEVKLVREK